MPFTISHAAAVLPFTRPLSRFHMLSAAVIGSMVPDFGLFMPWRPPRMETHSALGLLTFCLPVGLVTYWLFERLLKTPLCELLADSAYVRARAAGPPADIFAIRAWWLAACGILLGAVSHLVWDAFTHEGARGIRMIPMLDDPALDIAGHHLAGARLLQDLSSLVGLALVVIVAAVAWTRQQPAQPQDTPPLRRVMTARERASWVTALIAGSLLLSGAFLLRKYHSSNLASSAPVLVVGTCAIAALRGFAGSLIAVTLLLRARLHRLQRV